MPRPAHVVQWSNHLVSCVVERDVRGSQGSRFGAQSEPRSGKARPPIVKNYFITIAMHMMIMEIIPGSN